MMTRQLVLLRILPDKFSISASGSGIYSSLIIADKIDCNG